MTKDPRAIILRPIVTEKSTALKATEGKVQFRVHPKANKIEIKKAIEEIFNVKVIDVHTQNYIGKIKRLGRYEGKRPDWKKAIVTLAEGQTIDIFEGT